MKKIKSKYPKVKEIKYQQVYEPTTENSSIKQPGEFEFERAEAVGADQQV